MCPDGARRTSPPLNFGSTLGSVFVSRKAIAIALLTLAGLMLFSLFDPVPRNMPHAADAS